MDAWAASFQEGRPHARLETRSTGALCVATQLRTVNTGGVWMWVVCGENRLLWENLCD